MTFLSFLYVAWIIGAALPFGKICFPNNKCSESPLSEPGDKDLQIMAENILERLSIRDRT
jgi:hypothetical protein